MLKKHSSIPLQPIAKCNPERNWLSEQGRVHRKAGEMSKRVCDASMSGKRMMPVMRNYLRNPDVRLSAALKALCGKPSRSEAFALKNRVNAWSEEYDPIRWRLKKKSRAGERVICTLPLELKAVHYMLKRPLEKLLHREDTLFGVKDFGRDELAVKIKALQNKGYVHTATLDVVNCYSAVNPDALYELPLPKEVIKRTLDERYLRFEKKWSIPNNADTGTGLSSYDNACNATGPRGLLQGSPLSGVILAWLLNGIPSQESAQVYLCFDNIIVLAKSANETRAMVDTLAAHFERCSAGPLALHDPIYADNKETEFLGYLFDPARSDIGIADGPLDKFTQRLTTIESTLEAKANKFSAARNFASGENSMGDARNFINAHCPIEIWNALRSFRAGFSKTETNGQELTYFSENSRWLAEWSRSDWACFVHDHLFADKSTPEGMVINDFLRKQSYP